MRSLPVLLTFVATLTAASVVSAEDNTLSDQEKKDGWVLLFNGQDYTGWKCNNGKEIASKVEENCLVPYKSGGYIVIHEKQFGDFVLACDVKMPERCNSGIFFRVAEPKNPVNSGFEAQILTGKGTGSHDFGAIYDLANLTKNASKGAGEWNHVEITCKGPMISVEVNGEKVCSINCDDFDNPVFARMARSTSSSKAASPWPLKTWLAKGILVFKTTATRCGTRTSRSSHSTSGWLSHFGRQ